MYLNNNRLKKKASSYNEIEEGEWYYQKHFTKIWDLHIVDQENKPAIIYIDLHLVHEVTSPQAFEGLRLADRKVRRPDPILLL